VAQNGNVGEAAMSLSESVRPYPGAKLHWISIVKYHLTRPAPIDLDEKINL
jgi:hypothetical protein